MWNVQGVALKLLSIFQETDKHESGNVLLRTYGGSLETKYLVSVVIKATLNPILNLTNSVNKTNGRLKHILLKQPFRFSLLLQVFELFYRDLSVMLYQVSYRVSLLCQQSHGYEAGYVMQTSKCISLQIIHYGKSVLRS